MSLVPLHARSLCLKQAWKSLSAFTSDFSFMRSLMPLRCNMPSLLKDFDPLLLNFFLAFVTQLKHSSCLMQALRRFFMRGYCSTLGIELLLTEIDYFFPRRSCISLYLLFHGAVCLSAASPDEPQRPKGLRSACWGSSSCTPSHRTNPRGFHPEESCWGCLVLSRAATASAELAAGHQGCALCGVLVPAQG